MSAPADASSGSTESGGPARSSSPPAAEDGHVAAPDSLIRPADGRNYWQGIDASVDGMLGGFPAISAVDLRGSRAFLVKLGFGKSQGLQRAKRILEGGAGIGRITKGLLLDVGETVDVVEPIAKFTDELRQVAGVGRVLNAGLEDWAPVAGDGETTTTTPARYDVVWLQWCVGHLTDAQLVTFLGRAAAALAAPAGVIVLKENNATAGADEFDDVDSSVTRTDDKFRRLFRDAGLRLVRTELQNGLPKRLYPVRMYALKP